MLPESQSLDKYFHWDNEDWPAWCVVSRAKEKSSTSVAFINKPHKKKQKKQIKLIHHIKMLPSRLLKHLDHFQDKAKFMEIGSLVVFRRGLRLRRSRHAWSAKFNQNLRRRRRPDGRTNASASRESLSAAVAAAAISFIASEIDRKMPPSPQKI